VRFEDELGGGGKRQLPVLFPFCATEAAASNPCGSIGRRRMFGAPTASSGKLGNSLAAFELMYIKSNRHRD